MVSGGGDAGITAKRNAAKSMLYAKFSRGPTLGHRVCSDKTPAHVNPTLQSIDADLKLHNCVESNWGVQERTEGKLRMKNKFGNGHQSVTEPETPSSRREKKGKKPWNSK